MCPKGTHRLFLCTGAVYSDILQRANRIAVERSSHLIAYISHPASSAREILFYAERRAKKGLIHVENIADAMK